MKKLPELKNKPLLMSALGWLFFPGMYLLAGILTAIGVSVEASFVIASPAGVIGVVCWVAALLFSIKLLVKGQYSIAASGGLVASLIPLAFLGYGFWVAVNGGV